MDNQIPDCNPALPIKHGTVSFENKVADVVKIGTKAIFRCSKGYVIYGNPARICEASGNGGLERSEWSGFTPICYSKLFF